MCDCFKGAMHCLHAVLCFDVWKPLNTCSWLHCVSCQVHVAGGKVQASPQASHDFYWALK